MNPQLESLYYKLSSWLEDANAVQDQPKLIPAAENQDGPYDMIYWDDNEITALPDGNFEWLDYNDPGNTKEKEVKRVMTEQQVIDRCLGCCHAYNDWMASAGAQEHSAEYREEYIKTLRALMELPPATAPHEFATLN